MRSGSVIRVFTMVFLFLVAGTSMLYAQVQVDSSPNRTYKVIDGVLREVVVEHVGDSVVVEKIVTDSILSDTVRTLSKKELRRAEKAAQDADSTWTRQSKFFRDSIPISRMTAISFVVPGFSQLYNEQYYKIPILYATFGATLTMGIRQNKSYRNYKRQYDALIYNNASRDALDPVQTRMIEHNTYRQVWFGMAAASYLYFICDGAINYPGELTRVKKATTLSTICPGAGQVYNGSYWKVPIVMGGFASLIYVIDWNNRGYKRFKLAHDILTDGNPNTVDEFNGRYSAEFLRNYRNSYRRNRDLAIILTGAFYLLNIIDAHVDAHLKDYDVSDNLSFMSLEPVMDNYYTQRSGSSNTFGLSLKFSF